MIIKKSYLLREVAGTHVVLPMGSALVDFNGVITLNESGVMLWKLLEQGTDVEALVEAMTSEYNVSEEEALNDIHAFINDIRKAGCLEE